MENNENNSQEFAPQDGGYTQAPTSQGNASQGQQNGGFQSSNQYNGQQNGGFQSSNQYNGQPYGGQGYMPPQKEPKGFAIAGMVLGIVSIVCCCSPYIGGITGLLGLVFSIIVLAQKRPGKGMAIAGVVCAALGLLLSICMFIANNSMMEYIQQNGGMEAILREIENGEDFY